MRNEYFEWLSRHSLEKFNEKERTSKFLCESHEKWVRMCGQHRALMRMHSQSTDHHWRKETIIFSCHWCDSETKWLTQYSWNSIYFVWFAATRNDTKRPDPVAVSRERIAVMRTWMQKSKRSSQDYSLFIYASMKRTHYLLLCTLSAAAPWAYTSRECLHSSSHSRTSRQWNLCKIDESDHRRVREHTAWNDERRQRQPTESKKEGKERAESQSERKRERGGREVDANELIKIPMQRPIR